MTDSQNGSDIRSSLPLVALLVAIAAWANVARDTDAWLPDPWLPIAVSSVVLWVICGSLPSRWIGVYRAFLVVIPVCAILGLEGMALHRDRTVRAERIVHATDPLLRYIYRPGAALPEDHGGKQLHVNRWGMWDLPREKPRKPGVLRIALLGDSVPNDTYIPWPQRFHRILEARLNATPPPWARGRRIEVLNFAVEGYNTLQQERLYEQVASQFAPDLVLWTFVLNDAFTQDGSFRRVGHSFFVHKIWFGVQLALGRSPCAMFTPMYAARGFSLVVQSSWERMRLFAPDVPVAVAVLPLTTDLSSPACVALYQQVVQVARTTGFPAKALTDGFEGQAHRRYVKVDEPSDLTHPNAAGHAKMAESIDAWLRKDQRLREQLVSLAAIGEK